MSLSPQTIPAVFDLFAQGTGATGTNTGTQAGLALGLPPGRKAIQLTLVTSATLTLKVQNSVDKTTWFDVTSATSTAQNALYEVDSAVPFWRVNVTAHTTSGTGSNVPIVAQIAQLV